MINKIFNIFDSRLRKMNEILISIISPKKALIYKSVHT
jgi:hypothetical protein